MNKFEYADEKIGEKEIMVAVPAFVIGVGILSLPQDLASVTKFSDGMFSLIIAGTIMIFFTWAIGKFVSRFPNKSFLSYASLIVTRPIAIVLTCFFAVIALSIAAFQVRKIADISKHYLFDQTPVEIISLTFLMIIVYAVSGSRVGVLRLNMLFLPFILFISFIVILFNFNWFEAKNLLPLFQSGMKEYVKGVEVSILSFAGFGSVLWFYTEFVRNPEKTAKMGVFGMCIPIGLYILIYVACIGVYGNLVTANLNYPTVELAKMVEIPGGILERFESIFFVIWIMAIFNTAAMAYDITVLAIHSVFKRMLKIRIIFIVAPVMYLISMFPQNILDVETFGTFVGHTAFFYSIFILLLLSSVAKIRGVKRVE